MTIFVSREGYFKKITPQSLRMSGEQRFKEGDGLRFSCETTNAAELLVFSDRCQVYKARCADFDDGKASLLGDYLPTKLGRGRERRGRLPARRLQRQHALPVRQW